MRLVLILITWLTVIVLPLWLLLWAQIRFLPYHDAYITWGQRFAAIADIIILCSFWPRIVASQSAAGWWGRRLYRIYAWFLWPLGWAWALIRSVRQRQWPPVTGGEFRRGEREDTSRGAGFLAVAVLITTFISLGGVRVPEEWWEKEVLVTYLPESWIVIMEGKSKRKVFWPTYICSRPIELFFIVTWPLRRRYSSSH